MSSDIGSLSDGPDQPGESITEAKARVAAERDAIEKTNKAFRRFQKQVGAIKARFGGGDLADNPTGATFRGGSPTSEECHEILAAYEETLGEITPGSMESKQDVVNSFAAEFSTSLAEMLVTSLNQNSFPPTLKAGIIDQVSNRVDKFESAKQALDIEYSSLCDVEDVIKAAEADIELLQESLDEFVDIHWVTEMYSKLEDHERALNEAARSRQELLNSTTGSNNYTIDHRLLVGNLYDSWTLDYPGLNAISGAAQHIDDAKTRVADRLNKFT